VPTFSSTCAFLQAFFIIWYAANLSILLLKIVLNRGEFKDLPAVKFLIKGLSFALIGIFLNFPYTHTRYGELTESDFLDYSRENFNGYMPYWGVGSEMRKFDNEIIDAASVTESEPIAALAEEYLRKVCELCVQEDIPLLLMNPPFPGLTEEAQRKYNYAEAVAGEYGVPVLDGNKYVDCLDRGYV